MSKHDNLKKLMIVRCGMRPLRSWNVPMRSLSLWHLYVNDTPGGKLVYSDHCCDIPPNIPLLIPPHTVFATRMDKPMKHFYIDFQINLPQFEHMPRKEIFLPPFKVPKISSGKLELFGLLFNIFAALPIPSPTAEAIDNRFEQIIELLETGEQDFDIVCRKASLSRRTGERLFKKNTGLTPRQYIENQRMDMAYNQLLFTENTISEIACSCGYADRYHFSKCFKKVFGIPPVQFRELHNNDDSYPDERFYHSEDHRFPQAFYFEVQDDSEWF